jgi:hypothetical protein
MNKNAWIISGLIGLIAGYFIGNIAPWHRPDTLSLTSGTYCCDRIDIGQTCVVKTSACPADKPITVLVP